jgi:hypothetical protein
VQFPGHLGERLGSSWTCLMPVVSRKRPLPYPVSGCVFPVDTGPFYAAGHRRAAVFRGGRDHRGGDLVEAGRAAGHH